MSLWFGSGWDTVDLPSIGEDCGTWGVFIMRGLGLGNPAFVFISTWLDFTRHCHSAGQMNKFPLRLWGFPNRLLKPSQWINCCLCFNVLRSFPLNFLLLHPYYLHLQSPPSSKIRIYPLFCLRLTYHVPCAIRANEMYVRQVLFCTSRQILLGWLNRGTEYGLGL